MTTQAATTTTTENPGATGAPAGGATNNNGGTGVPAASVAPAWLPGADADTMNYIQAKGWKEPSDVLNSYRNGEKLWGAFQAGNAVMLPGENADQKTRDAFFTKLGRPESVDKYSAKGKDFVGMDVTDADGLLALAHSEGFTDKQVAALQKWNNTTGESMGKKLEAAATLEVDQQKAKLKGEWGAAHDQNMQTAQEAAKKLGWSKEQISAMQLALGYDGVMKLAHQLGTQVGESKFIEGEGGRSAGASGGKMTPAQAKLELQRLTSDQAFQKEWMDKMHPNHAAAVARKSQLSAWSIGAE